MNPEKEPQFQTSVRNVETTVVHVRWKNGGWSDWHVSQEGEGHGRILVHSDYGVFGFAWTSTGCKDFKDFVRTCYADYVVSKFSSNVPSGKIPKPAHDFLEGHFEAVKEALSKTK